MTHDRIEIEPTSAALFALLWNDLADVLGSSATATLLRRAAKHGASKQPALQHLVIHRPEFEYEYILPVEWTSGAQGRDALTTLCKTLVPLLQELTGPIVIQRLRSIPELVRARLVEDEEAGSS